MTALPSPSQAEFSCRLAVPRWSLPPPVAGCQTAIGGVMDSRPRHGFRQLKAESDARRPCRASDSAANVEATELELELIMPWMYCSTMKNTMIQYYSTMNILLVL